jgi:hypothetical protein
MLKRFESHSIVARGGKVSCLFQGAGAGYCIYMVGVQRQRYKLSALKTDRQHSIGDTYKWNFLAISPIRRQQASISKAGK